MLSQISDLVEIQQELGEGPAGLVVATRETAARGAPWEVGTRAMIPWSAWVWCQGLAQAPAPLVFDPDFSPLNGPLLPHAWHEKLAEHLAPPRPSGFSAEAGGCLGNLHPSSRQGKSWQGEGPKHRARSSTGTTPLAMLVWFLPKLADPIHGARHMSVTPRHEPCAWPTLASL